MPYTLRWYNVYFYTGRYVALQKDVWLYSGFEPLSPIAQHVAGMQIADSFHIGKFVFRSEPRGWGRQPS